MSGGHFDYQQYRLLNISDSLDELLDRSTDEYYNYDPVIIEAIKKAKTYLELAYIYVNNIDLLVSGDTSTETFIKYLTQDLLKQTCNNFLNAMGIVNELQDRWWTTPNKAFDLQTPDTQDIKLVYNYLRGQIAG